VNSFRLKAGCRVRNLAPSIEAIEITSVRGNLIDDREVTSPLALFHFDDALVRVK
jgi:hypothetical protein